MEKGRISIGTVMRKRKVKPDSLLQAEIKAEAYDEMIKIAEARYRIPIRKKTGAKQ